MPTPTHDEQGKPLMPDAEFNRIHQMTPEQFHRFIPTLLKMRGYGVIEVPVSHRPRRFGRSKYGVLNRASVAFADLLAIRWMNARLLRYEVVEDVGGDLVRD